jgi:prepilin-type processing-associated H-X9-DG protein
MPSAMTSSGKGGMFVQRMNDSQNTTSNNMTTIPLMVDVSASGPAPGYDFLTGIPSANVPTGYYRPAHMNKKQPAGGNILFLDNHVGWRRFLEMKAMYAEPSGRAVFWY